MMLEAMPEHAGSICPSDAQKCHVRNVRTNATNARQKQLAKSSSVPYAAEAVDNPKSDRPSTTASTK